MPIPLPSSYKNALVWALKNPAALDQAVELLNMLERLQAVPTVPGAGDPTVRFPSQQALLPIAIRYPAGVPQNAALTTAPVSGAVTNMITGTVGGAAVTLQGPWGFSSPQTAGELLTKFNQLRADVEEFMRLFNLAMAGERSVQSGFSNPG